MKYVLLLIVAMVFWWVWKKRSDLPRHDLPPAGKGPESIVACVHCGVLHPLSESLIDGSAHYCSEAHRLAGKKPTRP